MKILLFIDSLGSGGAQRQIINLAFVLKENGYSVEFLVYDIDKYYNDLLIKQGFKIVYIVNTNYWQRLIRIRKYIRRNGFDVVLSFLMIPNLINIVAGFPFRRNRIIISERSANPLMQKTIKFTLIRLLYIYCDHLIVNSVENLKMIQESNFFLKQSKCSVIYNMIDLALWKPINDFRYLDSGKLKMIIVASHQYLKNLHGLINALMLFGADLRSKLSIEWYGDVRDDSLNDALERIKDTELIDVIKFFPATIHIRNKIQNSDVVGLFSLYEGFPNAICEAMACAKPVIVSNVSDLPMIIENGKNGFICNPNDASSIYQAIEKMLACDEKQLAQMGIQNLYKAQQLFDKDKVTKLYKKLL